MDREIQQCAAPIRHTQVIRLAMVVRGLLHQFANGPQPLSPARCRGRMQGQTSRRLHAWMTRATPGRSSPGESTPRRRHRSDSAASTANAQQPMKPRPLMSTTNGPGGGRPRPPPDQPRQMCSLEASTSPPARILLPVRCAESLPVMCCADRPVPRAAGGSTSPGRKGLDRSQVHRALLIGRLSEAVLDADVDILGRRGFFSIARRAAPSIARAFTRTYETARLRATMRVSLGGGRCSVPVRRRPASWPARRPSSASSGCRP